MGAATSTASKVVTNDISTASKVGSGGGAVEKTTTTTASPTTLKSGTLEVGTATSTLLSLIVEVLAAGATADDADLAFLRVFMKMLLLEWRVLLQLQ